MKTIKEYINYFDNLYNEKLKEFENEEGMETIDAECYFDTEEFENSVDEDTFVNVVVGHWLWLTGGDAQCAYDDYVDGYADENNKSEVELRIESTLKSFIKGDN